MLSLPTLVFGILSTNNTWSGNCHLANVVDRCSHTCSLVNCLKEFLRGAPANFLVKYKNSASLSANIRRRLRKWSPVAWPDFDTLAHQLNASPATLRRRLDNEGESYRSIRDDLRQDLAISLLSDTQLSMSDIAGELGFAESSAFHRTFKKWTGIRPGEYRGSVVH